MMIPFIALLVGQAAPAFVPNAKLGTPYLLGYVSVISGTKTVMDVGSERWVTLNSVRTALSFAGKHETFLAAEGKKLVLLNCTIKNPSKTIAQLSPDQTFGVRIFDAGAVKGDYHNAGAVGTSLEPLHKDLKKGESTDFTVVFYAPAKFSTLRIGLFFGHQGLNNMRKYDLTTSVAKSTSVFSTDGLTYSDTAQVSAGQIFELDALEARVLGIRALPGELQYAVDVQITNRTLLPAKWGWQYVAASLTTTTGESIAFYPDFLDQATGKSWYGEIPAGASVTGEYRFNPGKSISVKSCTLKTASTNRTVVVNL